MKHPVYFSKALRLKLKTSVQLLFIHGDTKSNQKAMKTFNDECSKSKTLWGDMCGKQGWGGVVEGVVYEVGQLMLESAQVCFGFSFECCATALKHIYNFICSNCFFHTRTVIKMELIHIYYIWQTSYIIYIPFSAHILTNCNFQLNEGVHFIDQAFRFMCFRLMSFAKLYLKRSFNQDESYTKNLQYFIDYKYCFFYIFWRFRCEFYSESKSIL